MGINNEALGRLLKVSREKMMKARPPQPVPKLSDSQAFYKWYKDEILWVDSQIDSVEESCGVKNSCCKGCSSCCYQPIFVTPVEMLGIRQHLENLGRKEQEKLMEIVLGVCNRITESGIERDINKIDSETEIIRLMNDYFKLGISCPLLSADKECLVYEVRPTNCWSYRMYGDPGNCAISFNPEYGIKFDDWEYLVLNRLFEIKPEENDGLLLLPFALKDLLICLQQTFL